MQDKRIRAWSIGISLVLTLSCTSLTSAQLLPAGVRAVDTSAALDGDGLTWATAYRHLQDALEEAGDPENDVAEVWVAAGTYYPDQREDDPPTDDRAASFDLVTGVKIYGGFAGDEDELLDRRVLNPSNKTTLSGDIDADGVLDDGNSYHVVTSDSNTNDTRIDGFTITMGNAEVEESGYRGAGMDVKSVDSLGVINCVFSQNCAGNDEDAGHEDKGFGGAVAFFAATGSQGPGNASIVNCVFDDNRVIGHGSSGGALLVTQTVGPQVVLLNSRFTNNRAEGGTLFEDASGHAGAIQNGGNLFIQNCTIADNESLGPFSTGGAIHQFSSGSTTIVNSIVWNNIGAGGQIFDPASHVTLSFSLLTDPAFVAGDYRLASGSPAIDSGSDTAIEAFPDTFNVDNDQSVSEVTPDLDHLIRQLDGDGDEVARVDMGAYEASVPCSGDVDGDGGVGFTDLLEVLANWGPCENCPADIDGSGEVGFTDLVTVLSSWGPCNTSASYEPPQSVMDCINRIGYGDPDTLAACIEAMMIVGTP